MNIYYYTKLKHVIDISEKAYKVIAYDGSEAILPKSQVIETDIDNELWVSAWILDRVTLQHSNTISYVDENKNIIPRYKIKKHIPKKIEKKSNYIKELRK